MTTREALLRRRGTAAGGRTFLIRPTSLDDAGALVALRDSIAAEGDLIAAVPGERSAIEESLALAGILSQGGLSLTLEVGGDVAGHLMARRLHGGLDTGTAEIAIAVHNTARGLGLGRILMETAIDWSRAVRLRTLQLCVFPSNLRAIALYRSLGFIDQSPSPQRVELAVGPRELLLMELTL